LLLVVLVGLAFFNAFPEELTYDTRGIISENPLFQPETDWWASFVGNYWGDVGYAAEYRPVALSILLFEYGPLGFGRDPVGYVAINIALHLLTTVLVWRLARRWLSRPTAAVIAGALFAVHPLATAVVPNIVGQLDLIAAVCAIASLLAWERHRADRDWLWATTAAGLWLLGMLSKESAAVVPGLIVLRELSTVDFSDARQSITSRLSELRSLLPFAVVGLLWFLVRHFVVTGKGERFILALDNPLVLEPLTTRWLTGVGVLVSYLGQAALPLTLSADYSFDQVPILTVGASMMSVGPLAALAAISILTVGLWLRWRPAAVGLLFFFVAIAPVANIVFLVGSIRGDRFLYLPLIGLCLFAGELAGRLSDWLGEKLPRTVNQPAVLILGLTVLLVLVVKTHRENIAWRTNLSVWEHAVVATPDNLKAHYNLAFFLPKTSPASVDRVLRHLEKAVKIENRLPGDDFNAAHINLGKAYLEQAVAASGVGGDLDVEGREWLDKALDVLREGEERESIRGRRRAWWERLYAGGTARDRRLVAGKAQFGDVELHTTMATVLDLSGRPDEAVEQLEKAIAIDPARGDLRYRLAIQHITAGQLELAESALAAATELGPENEDAWFRLAAIKLNRGAYREAIDALSEGRRHHPASIELEQTLRKVYPAAVDLLRRKGSAAEAEVLIRQAVDRDGLPPAIFD